MKAIVFKVRNKVVNPVPLRSLSLNALQREERSLMLLIKLAAEANREEFNRLKEVRTQKAKDEVVQACKDLGTEKLSDAQFDALCDNALKNGPHVGLEQDDVVSKRLMELMVLRLKLCRVEITRCKLARDAHR